jgi:hypothetical protein
MNDDPLEIFRELFTRAAESCVEPDAAVLSTVDSDGRPSGRYVLLKAFDERGFVFYTNLQSRKGRWRSSSGPAIRRACTSANDTIGPAPTGYAGCYSRDARHSAGRRRRRRSRATTSSSWSAT